MNEQTMEKFKEMFTNGFNGLTKQEFLKSFEAVVEMVLKIQKKNDAEIKAMWDLVEGIKSSNGQELKGIKDKAMSFCMSEMEKMYKEHDRKISEMDQKMIEMKDGEDANEEEIVKSVLEQIKLPEYKEIVLDTPEQLRNKLETLKDNERLDVSAIKGLREEIKELRETITAVGQSRGRGVAGPNANAVQSYDISSQFDGSTKAFNVPKYRTALMVVSSQAPIIYKPTTDFTLGNGTITFTGAVTAPDTGQTGIFLYIK